MFSKENKTAEIYSLLRETLGKNGYSHFMENGGYFTYAHIHLLNLVA
jgi:hypothetical protein